MLGLDFLTNTALPAVSKFAGSGLGQTAIGAGLGYGIDRLSGGNGGIGAVAGGTLGGLNAMSGLGAGQGFTDLGQDAYSNSFLGGLGGTAGNGVAKKASQYSNLPILDMGKSLGSSNQSYLDKVGGYLGKGLGYANKNQPVIKTGLDAFGAYNTYQDNANKARLSQEQLDMIRHQNALAEQKYNSDIARRGQVENNAAGAFNNSKLASYY